MSPEMLAYPFLFIAIFFESFILVTFLSAPARNARARKPSTATPSVAIIVPCFNEAATLGGTVASLLALEYPKDKLSIILVDDGSTDGTAAVMKSLGDHAQIQLIYKENGGKHTALNAGIAATRAELVGCLDADSFVAPDALKEIISGFRNPNIAAVTAAMSIFEPKSPLQYMQRAEYLFGITMRHVLGSINGLYVTPGPFSLYRAEIVRNMRGFRYGNQAEDMEMALRLQKAGYEIENAPRARVYTKAPDTVFGLIKQRTRWISGFLRNILGDYRGLLGNSRSGVLGTLVLPLALLSIASSMLLFFTFLISGGVHLAHSLSLRGGIPLAYAYLPHVHSLDWFYFPGTFFTVLAVVTIVTSLSMIVAGKYISKTPGALLGSVVLYVLLYGFVAPLWLIRASIDVAMGYEACLALGNTEFVV